MRSRPAISTACSLIETNAAWMWSVDTTGAAFGVSARAASAANSAGPIVKSRSGSSPANRASSGTRRGKRLAAVAIRPANTAATSLYARYCSSRAKSRSRASSSARSSSSSTSPEGSSRAAFRSSRVAATSRK